VGAGDLLSAEGMQSITDVKVAELMGVDIYVERPHESIPGVTVGEPGGPMYELVALISSTLKETGKVLKEGGYFDLGIFMVEALKAGEKARDDENPEKELEVVIERVRFPCHIKCVVRLIQNLPIDRTLYSCIP
jgi:hypothetical protein